MRTWWLATLLAIGCGGDPPAPCGALGQACCMNDACTAGAACMNHLCQPACGKRGQLCCVGSTCSDGSTCTSGKCGDACGHFGEACCPDAPQCILPLTCESGYCAAVLTNTGAPCTTKSDCAGTQPICITKDAQGVTWPGGYCSSTCNPLKNDPDTTINSACPGGNGTCAGSGSSGHCYTACTWMGGGNPCERAGYLCFYNGRVPACEPASLSECDPTKKASCPQDGGALIFVPDDGGADGGAYLPTSRTCVTRGPDDVGECIDGCDPLYPQAAGAPSPPCAADAGCYPNYDTGEGYCFVVIDGMGDGVPCMYTNHCEPGLTCHAENNGYLCRRMCGGPNNLPCPNGQTCVDLSKAVPKSVVGICRG